jgi:hypothetical protein
VKYSITRRATSGPKIASPLPTARIALQQVAARAGAHRGEDRVVVLEHRQHEHPDVGAARDDLARRLDAVQLGHLDVHHDDVGLQLLRHGHGLGAVDGLADHLDELVGRQQRAQPSPEDGVVVGDQRADGIHGTSS